VPDELLMAAASPDAPNDDAQRVDLAAPANALRAVRAAAREVAARALAERGFNSRTSPDDHWAGSLQLPRSGVTVAVEVRLPLSFPDALPKVAVSQERLPKRVAHVEVSGNVCLVPTSNVLVDADRPEDLVDEALRRTIDVLDRGLLGETDADFDAEFQAYWTPTLSRPVLSLCDADGAARQIVICDVTGGSQLIDQSWMVGDRIEDVEQWAKHVGAKIASFREGLFIPVSTSVPLAAPDQPTSLSEIAPLILSQGTPYGQQLFRHAIERNDYPQMVVLSMPEATADVGRRLAAVQIRRPDATLLKEAARGFRPGRVPATRVLSRIGRAPVERLNLRRVDRAYLVARGGAALRLLQATVIVVGIGAVGSEVARNLAALGVGHIRLVDPDVMNPDNVHRHVLGMSSTGYEKVAALTEEMRRSFPHLDVDGRPVSVETLLRSEPRFLLDTDLIVLATGDETLERRLNRLLQAAPSRLHTWLEPLGISGHAFACGGRATDGNRSTSARGCFECLYVPDDAVGLINRTALTAAGQEIRRSFAGCAGTFAPFSPLDARRTAADAAELAARLLTGAATAPVLVSWRGLHTEFEAAGYRLSMRATQIRPGARLEVADDDLVRDDCPICGAAARRHDVSPIVVGIEGGAP
jgi:hypothetical protein